MDDEEKPEGITPAAQPKEGPEGLDTDDHKEEGQKKLGEEKRENSQDNSTLVVGEEAQPGGIRYNWSSLQYSDGEAKVEEPTTPAREPEAGLKAAEEGTAEEETPLKATTKSLLEKKLTVESKTGKKKSPGLSRSRDVDKRLNNKGKIASTLLINVNDQFQRVKLNQTKEAFPN